MVDLGVRFDSNLTFMNHISEKINKLIVYWESLNETLFMWMTKLFYYFINQWYVLMSNLLTHYGVYSN